MAVLRRLVLILVGFLAANAAATGVIALALMTPLDFVFIIFFLSCFMTALPALATIVISEVFRIRHVLAFAGVGAIIGLACGFWSPFVESHTMAIGTCAGVVACIVYWRIAGTTAGAWKRQAAPEPPPPAPLPTDAG